MRYGFFSKSQIVEKLGEFSRKVMLILEGELLVLKLKSNEGKTAGIRKSEYIGLETIMKGYPDFSIQEVLGKGQIVGEKCLEKDEIR